MGQEGKSEVSEDTERFDAIIVGAGLAGCTAAYLLAEKGLEVVVIERGSFAGSKNMTGGRLYGHSLEKVIPGFAERAPVERRVSKERISLLTEDSGFTIDFTSESLKDPSRASYTVLRSKFDSWYAEQAESKGAMFIYDICVDDLIVREGKVCGVIAGEDEMEADVVLLADGAVSLLAQRIGMRPAPTPQATAVGAKEVISLDERTVTDRFGLASGEGCAWMFDGYVTDGHIGGGFLYTNEDSVSLGVVTTIGDVDHSATTVPEMLRRLEGHPLVAPLLEGGKVIEYTGRLILEGGFDALPKLLDDGVLLLGDSAGFGINVGYAVRGMDLAIESGRLAAETVCDAKRAGDFSAASLASYRSRLEGSFILKDMRFYRKFPSFMEGTRNMFTSYPEMVEEIMMGMFTVDGSDPVRLKTKVKGAIGKVGLWNLAMDVKHGMGAL